MFSEVSGHALDTTSAYSLRTYTAASAQGTSHIPGALPSPDLAVSLEAFYHHLPLGLVLPGVSGVCFSSGASDALGALSALFTLFAQDLSVEIVRYERLDEITSANLSSPFQSLYRGGNDDDAKAVEAKPYSNNLSGQQHSL